MVERRLLCRRLSHFPGSWNLPGTPRILLKSDRFSPVAYSGRLVIILRLLAVNPLVGRIVQKESDYGTIPSLEVEAKAISYGWTYYVSSEVAPPCESEKGLGDQIVAVAASG